MPLQLTISCSSKSRLVLTFLVLPFWYLLTQVVPDIFRKRSKTFVCVCVCIFVPTAWLLSLWQHNVITSLHVTALETVLHFCTFLLNLHFDLEPDYIIRKPMKHRFQRCIVPTEIFSTFRAQVEYISRVQYVILPIQTNGTECAQTHKSENIISASFTPFTWRI